MDVFILESRPTNVFRRDEVIQSQSAVESVCLETEVPMLGLNTFHGLFYLLIQSSCQGQGNGQISPIGFRKTIFRAIFTNQGNIKVLRFAKPLRNG